MKSAISVLRERESGRERAREEKSGNAFDHTPIEADGLQHISPKRSNRHRQWRLQLPDRVRCEKPTKTLVPAIPLSYTTPVSLHLSISLFVICRLSDGQESPILASLSATWCSGLATKPQVEISLFDSPLQSHPPRYEYLCRNHERS